MAYSKKKKAAPREVGSFHPAYHQKTSSFFENLHRKTEGLGVDFDPKGAVIQLINEKIRPRLLF
jgi:hypothetical protein